MFISKTICEATDHSDRMHSRRIALNAIGPVMNSALWQPAQHEYVIRFLDSIYNNVFIISIRPLPPARTVAMDKSGGVRASGHGEAGTCVECSDLVHGRYEFGIWNFHSAWIPICRQIWSGRIFSNRCSQTAFMHISFREASISDPVIGVWIAMSKCNQ